MSDFNKLNHDLDRLWRVLWIVGAVAVAMNLVAAAVGAVVGWHFLAKWW